jgi:ribosomal protein L40E
MFEAFAAIFIFIAIIAVTAVLFGGWLIVVIVRGGIGIMNHLLGGSSARPMSLPGQNNTICPQANCRAANPASAAFCRRCGRQMPRAQRVTVRRAAMW